MPKPKKTPPPAPKRGGDYEQYKAGQAEISRERSAAGREIGPLPPVADPERRARALACPRRWNETYFAGRFFWPFAAAQIEVMERTARCTERGGRFANAEPRGGGKTTRAETEVLRAIFGGWRRFVVLAQATEKLAGRSLKKIQRELETNDLLLADFPEICHPIRALGRIHNRAKGQTLGGEPTRIEWTAEGVVLPTVPGSAASAAVIHVAGLTGAVRGLSASGPAGEVVRPDMVVIDDAQTRESARSPTQTAERESIITDDLMGLAGPGSTIAAVMLCTVIYPNDLSDRFLDPDRHPEWQGLRTRMLEAFPTNTAWWDRYAEARRESFRSGDEGRRATEMYAAEREVADAGAVVSWPERMKEGELSGVQSAMNLYLDNPRGFKAEYQNEPEADDAGAGAKQLVPAEVAAALSGLPRYEVPREAVHLTAGIDAGGGRGRGLWYAVVAWDAQFGGAVVDYGCWPRQSRSLFAAADMRPGLAEHYPGLGETERLYAGLTDLTAQVLGREYAREGTGERLTVERCLLDAGWLPATVYRFRRESRWQGVVYPSKGIGRSATSAGVAAWKPRPGERSGFHWRLTAGETDRSRVVQFDTDEWKTALYDRLATAPGGRGRLTLFAAEAGQPGRRADHEMFAHHCAAESAEVVRLPRTGASYLKWSQLPHKPDNHLLDALVLATVAASVLGLVWSPTGGPPPPKPVPKPRVKWSEKYKDKFDKIRGTA